MESILTYVKYGLPISEDDESFDATIISHINSALFVLNQLGVGPPDGFVIKDKNSKWSEFLGEDVNFEIAKEFVFLKTKLAFDPPESSALLASLEKQVNEAEFRIIVKVDEMNIQPQTSD